MSRSSQINEALIHLGLDDLEAPMFWTLLRHLLSKPGDLLEFVTYETFSEALPEASVPQLIKLAHALTSPRIQALEMRYAFLNEYGFVSKILSKNEAFEALYNEVYIDHESGVPVYNFKDRMKPFFKASNIIGVIREELANER